MSDDEPIDVLDADGTPLLGADGMPIVKTRAAVHRDGDWHAAFHLWIYSRDGVLLQRRGRFKRDWPGYLDASAAGHLTSGERPLDGLREVQEELGLSYLPEQLDELGRFPVVDHIDESAGGGRNREHQYVYAVRDDRPLHAFTNFDPHEVEALVQVRWPGFLRLVHGEVTGARSWNGRREQTIPVAAVELVPTPYLPRIAAPLAELAGYVPDNESFR